MTVAVGTPLARYSRRTSSDKKALEDMIMAVRRDMEAEIQQAAAAMCNQLDDLRKENQQLRDDLRRTKEEMGLLQAHVREIREDGELPQTLTSSSFRLLVHLTHEGKGASYCKGIPAEAHAEVRKKFLPLKTRKGSATARASEEIVEPDIEEDDVSEEEEESPSVSIATDGASSGGASSKKSKASVSGGGRPPKQAKQSSLAQSIEPTGSQEDAKAVQRLCLREEFCDQVKGLVVVILPLYKALRMTDMEGATIGLLYHFMEEAYKEIEKSTILDAIPDGTRDIFDDAPKRDDILFYVKKR
ncbi:hypothetical protein L7F22_064800 [Adiantum nelumboides]|nr:hypothetical protein [Adiantum nelumboides]